MRSLSPDEAALWARVAATIRPLSRDARDEVPGPIAPSDIPQTSPRVLPTGTTARRVIVAPQPIPIQNRTLDSTWDRRLKGGKVKPDRVIDLHGKNLDQAWRAIDDGLARGIDRGERVILLITGHHRPGEPPIKRGKIRAAVHDWLAASRHAARIAAVRGAHGRHGGEGSLYLILNR